MISAQNFALSADFLRRYDKPGPRYTSYPPAPFFSENFEMGAWQSCLQASNNSDRISFYFHIPFCPHRCLYCGCNTEIGAKAPQIEAYHQAMLKEMGLVLPLLNKNRKVTQIHFGGGTPNFVPLRHIQALLVLLKNEFPFDDSIEIAIECDPNHLSIEKMANLREMGFNRLSLGVQDFNEEVLNAVERRFPSIHPQTYIDEAKKLGYSGVNLDLIYGLPKQTPESFYQTLMQAASCAPSRIVAFSYAHVPWLKPHQKALETLGLPSPAQKWEMLALAHTVLTQKGYKAIGMDHYALPQDSLAQALQTGQLQRNFQGYCTTQTTADVVAFGSSAISQLSQGYAQNHKESSQYIKALENNQWPLERAYFMTPENLFYQDVIQSLMCRGHLQKSELSQKWNLAPSDLEAHLKKGWDQLEGFARDGLLTYTSDEIQVTALGWMVVRVIAMAFDPLLPSSDATTPVLPSVGTTTGSPTLPNTDKKQYSQSI